MFTPISAILSLLFFASTLPNGVRLVELPSDVDSTEIIAGYTSGGLTGFTSTPAAKALLLDAYAAGGKIAFVNDLDRTALRITAPKWALPMLTDRLPALFREVPKEEMGAAPGSQDFKTKVEEEIRNALLGPSSPTPDYATDMAFVLISGPAPPSLRDGLAAIPKRTSATRTEETLNRLPAERTLRFKSDLTEGGIVFAAPVPGAYYKEWYQVLLLDRLMQRTVPIRLKTALPLTVRPYYYRLESTVPTGQFPEPVEENLLQELQRQQFVPASQKDLAAARQEALAYLDSKPVREWFASHDMLSRREEGMQWIQAMSADDMRVAARDLLIMNRVIASWAPRPRQVSVSSEALTDAAAAAKRPAGRGTSAGPGEAAKADVPRTAFPAHSHPSMSWPLPERLASGVSLVAGNGNAVFVSGRSITRFDREFTNEDLKTFQQFRPDRLLVFTTPASVERARQIWSGFKGNAVGEPAVSRGKVTSIDLPALFILKTFLDLKVIQAGWAREVSLSIDADNGSSLEIRAEEEQRNQVLEWVKALAAAPLPDAYFAWVREAAIHHADGARADLQALIWERDPQGTLQDLEAVSARHLQDVARIYF